MDVGPDDDQRQLRDAAHSILAAESPAALTRECYDDAERWRAQWETLVGLGWTGVGWPDSDGRGDAMDVVVLLEAAGAAVLAAPLTSTIGLAAGALRSAGPSAAEYAGELAAGAVAALAVDDAVAASPRLRLSGERLTGAVDAVRDASRAELFVAVAADDDGVEHVVVCRAGDGVTVYPGTSVDPSAPVSAAGFDVPVELAVAVPPTTALAVPLVAAAAELLGVADRALSLSVDYAKTRQQFGQAIGAFQGVKHRLADMFVSLERARSLTYFAAAQCTADELGDPATWRSALLAKAAAAEAADLATRGAVAVHGAIAQTWEHDAHLLLRRAWLGGALLGDSASHYAAAARNFVAASDAS